MKTKIKRGRFSKTRNCARGSEMRNLQRYNGGCNRKALAVPCKRSRGRPLKVTGKKKGGRSISTKRFGETERKKSFFVHGDQDMKNLSQAPEGLQLGAEKNKEPEINLDAMIFSSSKILFDKNLIGDTNKEPLPQSSKTQLGTERESSSEGLEKRFSRKSPRSMGQN